jgi:hypothetical protein
MDHRGPRHTCPGRRFWGFLIFACVTAGAFYATAAAAQEVPGGFDGSTSPPGASGAPGANSAPGADGVQAGDSPSSADTPSSSNTRTDTLKAGTTKTKTKPSTNLSASGPAGGRSSVGTNGNLANLDSPVDPGLVPQISVVVGAPPAPRTGTAYLPPPPAPISEMSAGQRIREVAGFALTALGVALLLPVLIPGALMEKMLGTKTKEAALNSGPVGG